MPIIAVLLLNLFTSSAVVAADAPTIRVRVASLSNRVKFSGMGLEYTGEDRRHLNLGFSEIEISYSKNTSGEIQWTINEVGAAPSVPRQIQADEIIVRGQMLRTQGLFALPTQILLHADRRMANKINLISKVDLEDYLRGVLPSEMPSTWPIEAQKAQAVAARSYALNRMQMNAKLDYDVDNDIMDQVYREADGALNSSTIADQAVLETQGVVLLDEDDQAVAAYYHADCGGHTEDAKKVWGGVKSTATVSDAGCPLNPLAHWTLQVSGEELARKIKAPPNTTVTATGVQGISESGRALKVHVTLQTGEVISMSSQNFRAALGFSQLRSTLFTVTRSTQGNFIFKGRGYGHGVGLCQWGARALARSGQTYQQILAHYYPQARIASDALNLARE